MDKKWIFFLLADIFCTVASVPESMFALEGNSVMLPMWKRGNLDADDAVWVFNQTKDVVRYYPHHPKSQQLRVPAPYEDRVEFDTITFSLELKNLQEIDSGLYRGEINAGWKKTVVEYRLSIFKPVSAPVLALKSVLSNDGLCNMTVSCRADDLSLTSSCNKSTCTQAEQTAFTSLSIFIKEGVIICNHSNSVNWSHDTMEIETVCSQEKAFSDKLNALIFGTAFGGVALLVACGVLICCVLHFRKLSRSPGKGKVYAGKWFIPTMMFTRSDGKDQSGVDCGKSLSPESAVKKQNPSTPRAESPLVVKEHSLRTIHTMMFRRTSGGKDQSGVDFGKSLSPESAVKKQNPSTPSAESLLVVKDHLLSVTPGSAVKTPSAIHSVVVNLMTPGSVLKKRNHTPKNERSETKSSVSVNLSSRFQS